MALRPLHREYLIITGREVIEIEGNDLEVSVCLEGELPNEENSIFMARGDNITISIPKMLVDKNLILSIKNRSLN